jgi:hypothetical protein
MAAIVGVSGADLHGSHARVGQVGGGWDGSLDTEVVKIGTPGDVDRTLTAPLQAAWSGS